MYIYIYIYTYYTILYYTILYYTILYYTVTVTVTITITILYSILYYIILYYTILYHTISLYHTILIYLFDRLLCGSLCSTLVGEARYDRHLYGQSSLWGGRVVFFVGFLLFKTLYHNFIINSPDVHRIHRNFIGISNWSALKKGISTTQPSHSCRRSDPQKLKGRGFEYRL